jgi:acyl-CoA dehydrogenase
MTNDVRQAVLGLLSSQPVRAADGSWDAAITETLLRTLVEQGWARVGLDEDLGGVGGSFADASDVVAATAYRACPSPLADMVGVTNILAERLRIALPTQAGCVLPLAGVVGDRAGEQARVAWGSWASHFLVIGVHAGVSRAALVPAADALVTPGRDVAGLPYDRVRLRGAPAEYAEVDGDAAALLWQLGALTRSVQTAAALERVLELTVEYTGQRRQFGRALAGMPVVRDGLALLAGEAAAARAAARTAVDAVTTDLDTRPGDSVDLSRSAVGAIAVAKVRAGTAATSGSRIAHQLHGAFGITREYELHRHTTSMWTWRDQYGSERSWADELGARLGTGTGDLWEQLTGMSAPTVHS